MKCSAIILAAGVAVVAAAPALAADFRLLGGFRPGSATVVDLDQLNGQAGPLRRITTYGVLRDPMPGRRGAVALGIDTDTYDCAHSRFWPSALVLYDPDFRRVAASPPGRHWVSLATYAGSEGDYYRLACGRDPAVVARGVKLAAVTWPAAVAEARRRLLATTASTPRRPATRPDLGHAEIALKQ
jgi:hypothetical protein